MLSFFYLYKDKYMFNTLGNDNETSIENTKKINGVWRAEFEDKFIEVSWIIGLYMQGLLTFIVKDLTPHEQRITRIFMLVAMGGK